MLDGRLSYCNHSLQNPLSAKWVARQVADVGQPNEEIAIGRIESVGVQSWGQFPPCVVDDPARSVVGRSGSQNDGKPRGG